MVKFDPIQYIWRFRCGPIRLKYWHTSTSVYFSAYIGIGGSNMNGSIWYHRTGGRPVEVRFDMNLGRNR